MAIDLKNKETADQVIKNSSLILTSDRQLQKEMYRRQKNYLIGRADLNYDYVFEDKIEDWENEKEKTNIINPEFGSKVTDALAVIFENEPIIIYEPDTDRKIYGDEIPWNQLRYLNKMINGLDTIATKVSYSEAEDKIKMDIITPDLFDVVTNEDNHVEVMIYEVRLNKAIQQYGTGTRTFYLWSNEVIGIATYYYGADDVNNSTTVLPPVMVYDTVENMYGKLPFAYWHQSEILDDFFTDTRARRLENSENSLLFQRTGIENTFDQQSYSILTLTTYNNEQIKDFKVSPKRLQIMQKGLQGDTDERLEFVSPNVQLSGLDGHYTATVDYELSKYGLQQESGTSGGSVQSGISIALNDETKNSFINSDRHIYEQGLTDMYEIIKVVNNYHAKSRDSKMKKIDENSTIKVSIPTREIMPSLTDQLEKEQFLLDNNMTTKTLSLMELQNVTEEEAKAIIAAAELEAPTEIPEESEDDN
ncbi:MAG: hypothetical protein ACRBG0_27805 [Lewinella sp.]|uniref:hypothetical protein n=1 Tax=Lewinella sp. TaxID=2004506 RepID=UPI003D6B80DA